MSLLEAAKMDGAPVPFEVCHPGAVRAAPAITASSTGSGEFCFFCFRRSARRAASFCHFVAQAHRDRDRRLLRFDRFAHLIGGVGVAITQHE